MVEEALSGPTPHVDTLPRPAVKTQTPVERAGAAAKKAAGVIAEGKAAGKADKKQKLISHLLIGFLMAVIALAGYAFFGPQAHASAVDPASNHFVDVATGQTAQTANTTTINGNSLRGDLAAMQAEMDAITRQMHALKTGNMASMPMGMPAQAASTTYNNTAGTSPDQVSARLDQMNAMMNELMSKMNGMNTQTGGMRAPASGSGHSGHH